MFESIMAGVAISIGFLTLSSSFGPLSFSIGLYVVLWMRYNLFTGKIGYVSNMKDLIKSIDIFFGNALGCCVSFIVKTPSVKMIEKVNTNPLISLIEAIICGMLIFIAVQKYKEGCKLAPLLCVPGFILAGGEHCIADICFLFSTRYFTTKSIAFIILVAIGNSIGALIVRILYEKD